MELKITVEFHDKNTDQLYKVGDIVDFSDARAKDILKLGFAGPIISDTPAKKTKKGE